MSSFRRFALLTGIFILFGTFIWYFFVLPSQTSLPLGFSQSSQLTHTEDNRFLVGGKWSGDTISLGEGKLSVIKNEENKAFLESDLKIQSLTGDPLFELNQNFVINRRNMLNYSEDGIQLGNTYFLFPKHLKKQSYLWWPETFGEPFNLTFKGEVKIGNINTYHFNGSRSDIDDSVGYSFLPLVPEKYLALSRATVDVFVEPVTGTIIDYRDSGTSYYATKDKKPVWDMAKWSNKFKEYTVDSRIEEAEEDKISLILLEVIAPSISLIFSFFLIIVGTAKKIP